MDCSDIDGCLTIRLVGSIGWPTYSGKFGPVQLLDQIAAS
jgi:hypothetical protein